MSRPRSGDVTHVPTARQATARPAVVYEYARPTISSRLNSTMLFGSFDAMPTATIRQNPGTFLSSR